MKKLLCFWYNIEKGSGTLKKFLNSNGSTWSKWDLHIHTPDTVLNDEFRGDWSAYITKLEALSGFSTLGITDYFSVENYFKVKKLKYEEGRLNNIELLLPNIELRLSNATDKYRAINYHVIFSPEVDKYIESKFLARLKFQYDGRTYNATKADLIDLGRCFKKAASDEAAYKEGVNQFKSDINDIHHILETEQQSVFKGKYFTAVANKQNDGASGIRHDQYLGVKNQVYKKSDMIFSSRPADVEFFLQKDITLGNPKPCIHGSDAHSLDKVCQPYENRFTWIKSNPSFEGLMQILTNPENRVKIQEENPDSKSDYNVIDKVIFKENNSFQSREILLNPYLNTIIGGKSSGKSLLLYKIASTASPNEILLRAKDNTWHNNYKNTFIDETDFEVHWRNGQVSRVGDLETKGRVTYIPQLYINSLSEDSGNDILQEKILDIVKNHTDVAQKLHQKNELEKNYHSELNQNSYLLAEKISSLENLSADFRTLQSQSIYEEEKSKLEAELSYLLEASKMTAQDEQTHKELLKNRDVLKKEANLLERNTDELSLLAEKLENINFYVKEQFHNLNFTVDSIIEDSALHFENLSKEINESIQQIAIKLAFSKEQIESNEKSWNSCVSGIKEIEEKYSNSEKIKSLREKIKMQEDSIKVLLDLKLKKDKISEDISSIKESLSNSLFTVFSNQIDFIQLINSQHQGSLKVQATIKFNQKKFQEVFIENFNLRKSLSVSLPENIVDTERCFIYNQDDYLEKIRDLLEVIINLPRDRYKNSFDLARVIDDLFKLYTVVILDVEKDNDIISEMSPGKRGLVLLELFLSINDEKHPILLDQPEDNLDNRTISTELVKFIRERSKERQIIVVTHNANLVILTDSENVIVANQDPQIIENEEFRFEYLSGALECNFSHQGDKLTDKGIRDHACSILEGGCIWQIRNVYNGN
ncbi:TrlF family AAA-like ATPase [Planococcus maritimus]|uniref:TrlF family AAA-like ATPase n=1 Tax=Planococcus maritimus TaxID=192421 RepID=UPI0016414AE5|nr:hypothetical protein [Planococcus maritimus]